MILSAINPGRFPVEGTVGLMARALGFAGLLFLAPIGASAGEWSLNSDLTCEARSRVVDRMGSATSVSIPSDNVVVGKTFPISWSRGPFPEREPIYLMISFDRPVRIEGKGLYGLLPDARAAFGIKWQEHNTRAVIPYYGRGVPKKGRIDVRPLVAGPLTVSWGIVGYTGCQAHVSGVGAGVKQMRATTSGVPEIVIDDPDDAGKPAKVLVNADRTRLLEVFDGSYRLLDAASRSEILNGIGQDPHFSPTGRYAIVPVGQDSGLYDSVDGAFLTAEKASQGQGQLLASRDWTDLVWGNNDSFVLWIGGGYGITALSNLVVETHIPTTVAGCRICGGLTAQLLIDQENNVIIATNLNEANVFTLDGRKILSQSGIGLRTSPALRNKAIAAARRHSAVSEIGWPKDLAYATQIALTRNIDPRRFSTSSNWQEESVLTNLLLSNLVPDRAADAAGNAVSEPAPDAVRLGPTDWRLSGTTRSLGSDWQEQVPSIENRLADLNIHVLPKNKNVEKKSFEKYIQYRYLDRGAMDGETLRDHEEMLQRISVDSGMARGRFVEGFFGCRPDEPSDIGRDVQVAWHWQTNQRKFWLTTRTCAEGSAAFVQPESYLFSSLYSGGSIPLSGHWSGVRNVLENDLTSNGVSCIASIDACSFEVQVFDKYLVLYSEEAHGYAIIDTSDGRLVTKRFDLRRGDLLDDILLTHDARHIVTFQKDGSFFVYRLADDVLVLSGRYMDDEIVVWTSDGRFDATAEGAHFVSYAFPGHFETYTAQQFAAFRRVSGLARQVLDGSYKLREAALLPPPVIVDGAVKRSGRGLNVSASITSAAPLRGLNVFQDGLLTDTLSVADDRFAHEWNTEVDLLPGTRWVSLVAEDSRGVVSSAVGRDLGPDQSGRQRLHVLAIGVNTYDFAAGDLLEDLDSAVSDADLFAQTMTSLSSEAFDIASVTKLLDNRATPEAILSAVKQITAKAEFGDSVAVFFAGHGLQDEKGRFFLGTSKTDASNLSDSALPFDAISRILLKAGTRMALFLDACHSALAGQGLFSTNDAIVDRVLEAVPSGIVVFSASKGREYSVEDPVNGTGVFTGALAEVINTRRSEFDLNGNGALEVSELFRGVKGLVVPRVNALAEADGYGGVITQTPWMARNRMVGDFVLF